MIYSPARRFVFIHIPKTGGTALTLALEARAKADDVLVGDTPKAVQRRGRQTKARPAKRRSSAGHQTFLACLSVRSGSVAQEPRY